MQLAVELEPISRSAIAHDCSAIPQATSGVTFPILEVAESPKASFADPLERHWTPGATLVQQDLA
jgi:hypothetical protein